MDKNELKGRMCIRLKNIGLHNFSRPEVWQWFARSFN